MAESSSRLAGAVRRVALGLLLLLFALQVLGARQNSITADEPAYVAGGYAVLAHGREALPMLAQRGYPPLLAVLEALPVYIGNPDIPVEQVPGWPADYNTFTQAFKPYLTPWERTEAAARMVTVCLTVLLGAVVWRWGTDLWGPVAGVIALIVMTLDPTMLAHGRLAHTDAGSTALGTAALFVAWRWSRRPSWCSAVLAGLLLAFTLLSKVSGPLWLVVATLIMLATLVERRGEGRILPLAGQGAAMMALAGLLWWAAYGLDWGRSSAFPTGVPAPVYWDGLQYLRDYATDVFALGLFKSAQGGWPWYFPAAFLIKNPLPALIALGIALVVLLRRASRYRPADVIALVAFPLLYTLVAIVEGTAIGYRHMLPVHPFIYLAIGGGLAIWAWGAAGQPWRRWVVAGLGLWLAVGTLRVFPWEMSFFNELAGGPAGGYRYLADSNVDWGQAGRAREAYLAAHPGTYADRPAAGFSPAPGRYLVGASALQGVGATDQYAYEWFRHRTPQEVLAGGSQLVFDGPAAPPQWLVQCNQPVSPLTPAAIAEGTGQPHLRAVEADCAQTWIYPAGGAAPGIYALHRALLAPQRLCLPALLPCPTQALDPFIARHLSGDRLSYAQPVDGELPAFVLFERTAQPVESARSNEVALAGPLAFLGATAYGTGDGLEVETKWRVVEGPIDRPFSIMGHLLDEEGAVVALADGSGVSPLALQPGDVIVQRHRFPQARSDSVQFETGAYWLDDLSRWPLATEAGDSIVLPLPVVTEGGRDSGAGRD